MRLRLSKIESALGASRSDVENYIRRLTMTSTFEEVVPRQARHFSYQNAIELGLIAALVSVGVFSSKAVAHARPHVLPARFPGFYKPERRWLVIAGGDANRAVLTDDPDPSRLSGSGDVSAWAVIDLASIFARIDALFEGQAG